MDMKDGTKRKGGKSRTLAGFLLLGVLLLLAVLVILYQCGIRAEDIFRPFSSAR